MTNTYATDAFIRASSSEFKIVIIVKQSDQFHPTTIPKIRLLQKT